MLLHPRQERFDTANDDATSTPTRSGFGKRFMQLRALPLAALPARSAAAAFVKAWSTAPGQSMRSCSSPPTRWVTKASWAASARPQGVATYSDEVKYSRAIEYVPQVTSRVQHLIQQSRLASLRRRGPVPAPILRTDL